MRKIQQSLWGGRAGEGEAVFVRIITDITKGMIPKLSLTLMKSPSKKIAFYSFLI
jgi:hypothetical protein